MNKSSVLFLFIAFFAASLYSVGEKPRAGDVVSTTIFPATTCADGTVITSYKVVYLTEDTNGKLTKASGLFLFPSTQEKTELSMVSYQHGTLIDNSMIPSSGTKLTPYLGCRYGKNSMVSAADYLGFGESPGFHPYHHAKTEASASIDMLKASLALAKRLQLSWNTKLFLSGYSQGGHSTMAVLRALSRKGAPFNVTATGALSGAYDLSVTSIAEMLKTPAPYDGSVYVGFLLSAYNLLYPEAEVRKMTLPAFDKFLDAFVVHDIKTIGALAPRYPKEMFSEETIQAVLTNANHPFVKALEKNNVYDFTPKGSVFFCYAGGDTSVPPGNSRKAYDHLKQLGADVSILNVGDALNHATASVPCEDAAKTFFDKFQ